MARHEGPGTRSITSFEDFYAAEYPRVFRAATLTCGDPEAALDATQEAFKRAFSRWRRLQNEAWAGGWVMTTALNECRRARRRSRRDRAAAGRGEAGVQPPPDPRRVDLLSAIRTLPFRQRQAVVLYYLGDMPVAVVARLMGISEGSVKAHLAHARTKLRPTLEAIDA
jgi:RNA polymerase sigma-70 factor, ECF subfamily